MKELLNAGHVLGRSEMKKIMAGSGQNGCQTGTLTCQEFYDKTGCYPTWESGTCKGTDGCSYSYASSSGSCG